MAKIRRFQAVHPPKDLAPRVAALPYDVYNTQEARALIEKEPASFLQVDLPLATMEAQTDPKDYDLLGKKALENYQAMKEAGYFLKDRQAKIYLYELTMEGQSQLGLVASASVDDYLDDTIKKHEFTRKDKETDRIHHVDSLDANTGPIFLTYRNTPLIKEIMEEKRAQDPLVAFVSEDGVGHRIWAIEDEGKLDQLEEAFGKLEALYIADGHHRSASAVQVALKRRKDHPDYTGEEEFNFFLAILFPMEEVRVMDYNRVVADLNGLDEASFLEALKENFLLEEAPTSPYQPEGKGTFGLYLGENWYKLTLKDGLAPDDPVASLDVSLLQDLVLDPILGIKDPRTDERIDFIGGIRGLKELERRVHEDMTLAFALYPTSLEELMTVADAGRVMPPKSTWFEPKPRSGLFIHELS
ncbi:MAG: DUF1015 family protein [Tissierellia bacterium]|nr:DUF1015 family protein [Tissierellia bacterium]